MTQLGAGLFLSSAAFILYVLFVYPLLLGLLSSRSRKLVRSRFEPRTVSVLLPVWNGEPWIRAKLESIAALNYPQELMEILVISDGSTDATEQIVRECAMPNVRLITLSRGGKALALNAGLREAKGEILFLTDVRQALDPDCLRILVACFGDPEVGVASGEIRILEGERREQEDVSLYRRYENWLRERLSRIDSVLGATGAIYAMRRDLAVPMPPDTLLDDMFLPLAAFFRGYRVVFDSAAYAFDYPTVLHSEFRRKVRTLAGNYQIMTLFPALLGPRNRMWFHFVSYKLARLLLPFAFLGLAAASPFLPGRWAAIALTAQAVFYGLAVLDLAIPENWPLKRLSSVTRTFVVLMAASFSAVSFFFTNSASLWTHTRVESAASGRPDSNLARQGSLER